MGVQNLSSILASVTILSCVWETEQFKGRSDRRLASENLTSPLNGVESIKIWATAFYKNFTRLYVVNYTQFYIHRRRLVIDSASSCTRLKRTAQPRKAGI